MLADVSQHEMDGGGADEEQEHRLADHFPGNRPQAAWLAGGQFVVAALLQAGHCLFARQAEVPFDAATHLGLLVR